MGIISWIILGGLAGWLASIVMGNDKNQGIIGNIIIGIIGGLVGGFIFSLLGGSGVTGFNIYSLLVAVVGAIVLLWIMRLIRGK